jgi:serine/threonine protein kinase
MCSGELRDGRVVAVKRLYNNSCRRVEQFVNEAAILSRLRHPNLVLFYGCTSSRSRELLLVYEFVPNGTVADHLHGHRAPERALTWPLRLNVAVEAAAALAYLHAVEPAPIVHRDVKTNNILLDANFHVKVADFGLSRLFPRDATHVSTAPQGTPGYAMTDALPLLYCCLAITGGDLLRSNKKYLKVPVAHGTNDRK